MCGAQCPFAHFAEHLRKFQQLRLASEPLDARQRAIALNQFLHLIMFIAKDRQLRQVRHAKDLMVASEMPEFEPDHQTHASADALINFIEDQRWDLVGACQNIFQRQHQARGLATGCNLDQRLESFARIRRNQKFHAVITI